MQRSNTIVLFLSVVLCILFFATGGNAANFVSNALGSHMVLQRSPYRSQVWGWSKTPKSTVELILTANDHSYNHSFSTTASPKDGGWTITLNGRPAGGPYTITVSSTAGESAVLKDILFGDVWICGGQSNMQFTLPSVFNASEQVKDANNYPFIRVMTVGQNTVSPTPLNEFATIEEGWTVGSSLSVGNNNWTYFSAVCWLFGKELSAAVPNVPIGLVSSNWGGTYVQAWSSPDALSKCSSAGKNEQPHQVEHTSKSKAPNPNQPSVLWNAMIVPLLRMRVKGSIWYQGEANVGNPKYYSCAFPAMITDWRAKFGLSPWQFGFYFVQLAAYTQGNPGDKLPEQRIAQTAALQLPTVAMATAIDLGDPTSPFGNIHPRNKETVGKRLALAAEALSYNMSVPFLGPTFASMKVKKTSPNAVVTVTFSKASVGSGLALAGSTCPGDIGVASCGWFDVQTSDGNWHNATSTTITGTNTIDITVKLPSILQPTGVRYGWAEWPVATLYNVAGLPAPPFVYSNNDD